MIGTGLKVPFIFFKVLQCAAPPLKNKKKIFRAHKGVKNSFSFLKYYLRPKEGVASLGIPLQGGGYLAITLFYTD